MENAETLTEVQIQQFLKGSQGIVFEGQTRAERYGWVQRVLVAQEYALQDKKRRGVVRAHLSNRAEHAPDDATDTANTGPRVW